MGRYVPATVELGVYTPASIDTEDPLTCVQCGGELAPLGRLGRNDWFRCVRCGWDQNWPTDENAVEQNEDALDDFLTGPQSDEDSVRQAWFDREDGGQ